MTNQKLDKKTVNVSKILRRRATDTENFLWRHLKSRQFEGLKFRRQQPIGNYIVDFACFAKRLIIEVDGGQHAVEEDKDKERDQWFKERGFKVLRFWDNEVLTNIEGVLEAIKENCLAHPPLR